MASDYRQIISALRNSVWYIMPESLEVILEIVNMRLNGIAFSDEEIRIRLSEAEKEDRQNSRIQVGGGIGVIPLYGSIFPKANLMTEISGATSLENFSADLNTLVNDDSVKHIVLDIDSPGGLDSMVPETAQQIREAREIKPIYAVANTLACSAAHYLGAQASKFYASPSSKVGSIGAYTVHEDISAANEKQGRKVTFISSAKFKTAGNEHEPLSLEARDYVQGLINESAELFIQDVALGRGQSVDEVRQYADGKVFRASTAAEMGITDGVRSLNDLVGDLLVENTPQVQGVLADAMAQHQKTMEIVKAAGLSIPKKSKEGRMNEEQLRTALGISADADLTAAVQSMVAADQQLRQIASTLELSADANVAEAVTELHEEIVPIREAQGAASRQQEFAKMFPAEHARLQALAEKDTESTAKAFAERYERFTKVDGDREVKSNVGFPAVTLHKIEDVHKAFATRTASTEMLGELLDLISMQGFVDFSERGSSRKGESVNEDPVQQFQSRITALMSNDGLDAKKATQLAISQHPDEYEAYREAMSARSKTTA